MTFLIAVADLDDPGTQALLRIHLEGMRAHSPPTSVFALDLSGLQQANVTVWSATHGGEVVGIGALKLLSDGTGEIKSMRTRPDYVRRGVGSALLNHIILTGTRLGLKTLLLETGSGPPFDAALSLYRAHGFQIGRSFGDYSQSEFNQFLFLELPSVEPHKEF